METTQPSISREWRKKTWCVYTHGHDRRAATEKEAILPFATARIDAEGAMLGEVSQTGKGEYDAIALTRGIQKNK